MELILSWIGIGIALLATASLTFWTRRFKESSQRWKETCDKWEALCKKRGELVDALLAEKKDLIALVAMTGRADPPVPYEILRNVCDGYLRERNIDIKVSVDYSPFPQQQSSATIQ